MMKFKTNKGFTLIEILIVIAISALIVGGVVVSFSVFSKNQSIESATSEILSELDEARALTLASFDNTVYGVHFESDKIVLFKGSAYSPVGSDNKITNLPSRVSLSGILLNGGGNNIVFDKLTGKTGHYGTLTISLVSDPLKIKVITIQESGIIEADI